MRSSVFRSRICEAGLGQAFLLDPGADPAGLSSVRAAIASISVLEVLVLDLDLLGLGDLGEEEEFLEAPEGRLVGVGPDLGLAGADLVVAESPPA